jgi:1,2-diacylglycerol 3-alpha-glucosyltransferase/glucuronosyltransferase
MRILLVTDAWYPQVNGVVRTLEALAHELESAGNTVEIIAPGEFYSVPMPGYPEIGLAMVLSATIRKRIARIDPQMIHIATEGPLGIAARSACIKLGLRFTTSYHTRFPEYLRARAPVPLKWTYAWLRRFHRPAEACLVATQSMASDLRSRGFGNIVVWPRGVDRSLFRPWPEDTLVREMQWKRPVFLNVGRVSVEKNLEAFLGLDLPGTKLVVGEGPARGSLERKYPDCVFVGNKTGIELVRHYSVADVFVFPSRTDTFGNVLLEALACGVPVAAFPVPGPIDVIGTSSAGVLNEDLGMAAIAALDLPKSAALSLAATYSWAECARIFIDASRPTRVDVA